MSQATSGTCFIPIPHVAEPVIGRAFARPVGSRGLLASSISRVISSGREISERWLASIASSDALAISRSGVPFRCEGWPDEALVLRESGDHRAILIVEPDAERVEIGLLAFGARGFRDHDDALLIQQPGDGHLRGAAAMLASEGSERCVARGPSLSERRVGSQSDAVAPPDG